MTKRRTIEPSEELAAWLAHRDHMLCARERIAAMGGHVMLRLSDIDPKMLEEPLRSEAIAYMEARIWNQ